MTDEDMAKLMPADNPIATGLGKILMKSLVESVHAEIQWEFAADDSVNASVTWLGKAITRRGSWRFISGDEKSTKLEIHFEDVEPREVSFTFLDPDTFEAAPLDTENFQLNRVVKFKRVADAP